MAGKIPQTFIDDLLDRVDIVDVVGGRVDLRKSGKNHSARCPFHDEKTPSFTVSQDKQFYYCFGCGAGGNAIGFVMDFDRISFPEAVETLAKQAGLDVPREAGPSDAATERRKALYKTLEQADRFFRSSLRHHHFAFEAVYYLKSRGVSGETARKFGIGFAPPGWDNMLNRMGHTDHDIKLLKESGMVIDQVEEHKVYDRFRHRIMFPIRDIRGRTIGFGGRVLTEEKPKYLNTPETPLFHKGRELYGLYEANKELREIPFMLVVEGYMDVVMLFEHGIFNVVATLGTSASTEHLEKLFRYTPEVVFCFDGDAAGSNAASRALDTCLPLMIDGRSARFMFLQSGEDPDSTVRQIGPEKFLETVQSATPISEFLMETMALGLNTDSPDNRARMWKQAAPMIKRMPRGVFRELMLRAVADKIGLDIATLGDYMEPEETRGQPVYQPPQPDWDYPVYPEEEPVSGSGRDQPVQAGQQNRIKMPPVHTLIALLANHPELAKLVTDLDALRKLDIEGLDILVPLVELILENPGYSLNHILGYWRGMHDPAQADRLAKIAATDLLRPVANSLRDNEKEFQEIQDQLLRQSILKLEPLQVIQFLATRETVDDHDLKQLTNAWSKLPSDQRTDEVKALFNQVLAKLKPR